MESEGCRDNYPVVTESFPRVAKSTQISQMRPDWRLWVGKLLLSLLIVALARPLTPPLDDHHWVTRTGHSLPSEIEPGLSTLIKNIGVGYSPKEVNKLLPVLYKVKDVTSNGGLIRKRWSSNAVSLETTLGIRIVVPVPSEGAGSALSLISTQT